MSFKEFKILFEKCLSAFLALYRDLRRRDKLRGADACFSGYSYSVLPVCIRYQLTRWRVLSPVIAYVYFHFSPRPRRLDDDDDEEDDHPGNRVLRTDISASVEPPFLHFLSLSSSGGLRADLFASTRFRPPGVASRPDRISIEHVKCIAWRADLRPSQR